MQVGLLYFIVIVLANTVGAISGMGGGVIIKPVFDLIGAHSVAAVSFYSAVAVLTMSIVSTWRQIKNGVQLKYAEVLNISLGAVLGGFLGNMLFSQLLTYFTDDSKVLLIQIVITIVTLLFAYIYSHYNLKNFKLSGLMWYLLCGIILGTIASLLGIGGGPINVSLLIMMFSLSIKEATVYSICTILFSQLTKVLTIGFTTGYGAFDLRVLLFVIPAAIIGGMLGANLSRRMTAQKVVQLFEIIIVVVIIINLYNLYEVTSSF